MNVEIFTVCEYAHDMGNMKLVVIGTFDHLFMTDLPAKYDFSIALRIRLRSADSGNTAIGVTIISPDGQKLTPPIDITAQFQAMPGQDSQSFNLPIRFNQFEFKQYGRHSVILSVNGQEVQTLPLYVVKPPQS